MSRTDSSPWRRLLILGAAGALLLAGGTAAAAQEAPDPGDDPALDQEVDSDEELGDEQVVVDYGHFDIGPRIIDDEWELLVRDDSVAPPVWRSFEDIVFVLPDAAVQAAPDDDDFDFLPGEPGDDLYLIPQSQDYEIPWLGWNTQDPDVVEQLARGMSLRLHSVEGPGEFVLFLQSGNFDPPQVLWDTAEGMPQDIWADTNTHVHANWVFSEPGVYLMDVELVGDLGDGTTGSSRDVLRFAVGSETDPQEVFGAELQAEPVEGDEPDAGDPDAATAAGEDEGGMPMSTVAILVGIAVLVLGGAAGLLALRSRRVRQAAEESVHQARRSR